ncbi:MAG: SpaA isopeptide-forming pilin-related protein [Agathobacter rectalis]
MPNAEFDVYKYDPNSTDTTKTPEGYVYVNKYVTDDKGKIEIVFNKNSMTYNTQYYVVETKAPSGYVLPEEPEKHISTLVRWIKINILWQLQITA